MDKFNNMMLEWGARVTDGIQSTSELARQSLGQVDHKTELPEEYLRLRARIQALEKANARMLKVTSHFGKETYDYPTNLQETFSEVSRNFLDSINTISHAKSSQELTAALSGNHPNVVHQPKTFSHAISRAAFASSGLISGSRTEVASQQDATDRLADALEKYAVACEQIGNARIEQDHSIQNGAINGWTEANKVNIQHAIGSCKRLEEARLKLDVLKSKSKPRGGLFSPTKKGAAPDDGDVDDSGLTEEQRQKLEEEEAAFASQVQDTESEIAAVLDMPDSIKSLVELVEAQHRYHQTAADVLSKLITELTHA